MALEHGFFLIGFGIRKFFVEVEHGGDEGDQAVVTRFVFGVGEIDGADGKLFYLNPFNFGECLFAIGYCI